MTPSHLGLMSSHPAGGTAGALPITCADCRFGHEPERLPCGLVGAVRRAWVRRAGLGPASALAAVPAKLRLAYLATLPLGPSRDRALWLVQCAPFGWLFNRFTAAWGRINEAGADEGTLFRDGGMGPSHLNSDQALAAIRPVPCSSTSPLARGLRGCPRAIGPISVSRVPRTW